MQGNFTRKSTPPCIQTYVWNPMGTPKWTGFIIRTGQDHGAQFYTNNSYLHEYISAGKEEKSRSYQILERMKKYASKIYISFSRK